MDNIISEFISYNTSSFIDKKNLYKLSILFVKEDVVKTENSNALKENHLQLIFFNNNKSYALLASSVGRNDIVLDLNNIIKILIKYR